MFRRLAASGRSDCSSGTPRLSSVGAKLASLLTLTLTLTVALTLLAPSPIWAQEPAPSDEAEETSSVDPAGSARLLLDGRQVAGVGFSLRGDGPRFALEPIAGALGVELRIGPLGDSHTLIFEDKKVLVGPDDPTFVTVQSDGADEEISRLRLAPIKTVRGLEVPLEMIEKTIGDELGYEIEWSFRNLELALKRRELRSLTGSLSLVHQYRISVVEISFSERPRYRFSQEGGVAEVRLVGDAFSPDHAFSRPADPLVTDIRLTPTKIQIDLTEDAVAGEPRLVPRAGQTSMVIEVYRRRGGQTQTATEDPRLRALDSLAGEGLRRIVIDPGHGGSETGAVGRRGVESELTLIVARLLKTRLEQRLPVDVRLTRDADVDIPLDSRVALANQVKADLFISLHMNSYRGSRARGAETYFLSRDASDQLAAQLAERENAAAAEADPTQKTDGDLGLILWDLAQSYHLTESQRFASLVQEELNQALGLRNRGVRQAPFRVLMGAAMPAVLVELGFLSNPEEEAKLLSPAYQAQLADALVRAVSRFKNQLEARRAQPAQPRGESRPSPGGVP